MVNTEILLRIVPGAAQRETMRRRTGTLTVKANPPRMGPGLAARHFMPRSIRDKRARGARERSETMRPQFV